MVRHESHHEIDRMRYLIDTNIFIFYAVDRNQLDKDILYILNDCGNIIHISSESVKELIHVFQNGRIKTRRWKTPEDILYNIREDLGFTINYVKKEHLYTLARLEPVAGHNDPSDRLIIAQAITERIPLISSDRKFEAYRKQQLQFIFNRR
ncbi:MAG: type II toxin-antitoxin system VapC family toxin [Tannerella sp.]|nr:type II toxin-antitoxin system VapC family toxin [Tannerella sp.]